MSPLKSYSKCVNLVEAVQVNVMELTWPHCIGAHTLRFKIKVKTHLSVLEYHIKRYLHFIYYLLLLLRPCWS